MNSLSINEGRNNYKFQDTEIIYQRSSGGGSGKKPTDDKIEMVPFKKQQE
jgi:hypothetical protein